LFLTRVTPPSSVELRFVVTIEIMSDERTDALDNVTDTLDELKTMVEELAESPPPGVRRDTVEALKAAIEKARDLADDLEDSVS
jgi:hypothetical protein